MERGVVTFTGVNSRKNQFGFLRSEAGDEVYFNTYGRSFVLVIEDGVGRFSRGWTELFGATWRSSPFPSVGQVVYFERSDIEEYGNRPRAHVWCEARYFLRLVEQSWADQESV